MSTSLAEKFGISIEPSRLTDKQKQRLKSDEYYFEVARSISLGNDVLIQVDRSKKLLSVKSKNKDSQD